MKQLWVTITQKLVEILSGLLMIGIGVFLTTSSDITQRIIGSFLTTVGGVLISWSFSIVYTRDQAREDLRARLEALRRQLGTVCGQISQALAGAQDGSLDANSSLALVSQSVQSLYGVVNEIQVMTGGRFEASDVLATVTNLEEFAQQLASLAGRPAVQDAEAELEQLSQQFSSYVQSLKQTDRPTTTVTLNCPECGGSVSCTIGVTSGDSAMPICPACGARFHAHRRADGSVFTRKWGFYSLVKTVPITCPTCSKKLYVRTTQDQTGLMIRYCLDCFTKLEIDVGQGQIVKIEKGEPIEGCIVGEEAGHSILKCPSCQEKIKAFAKKTNTRYAVCYRCDKLVKAEQVASVFTPGITG